MTVGERPGHPPVVSLRKAEEKDCAVVYGWRNHPKVREYFFDRHEISYEEHNRWFRESLGRQDRALLVACRDDVPVGVIRFDRIEGVLRGAEIDIYVAPERQGQGLGKRMLVEGEKWIRENWDVRSLKAKVKEENGASMKMFRACGFEAKYTLFEKEIRQDD